MKDPTTLVVILAVANIPVYLFLGWLAFDSKSNASDTFFGTLFAIVKRVLVPKIVLVLLQDEGADEAWGIFPIAAFLFACGGIVYGEYYLIQKYF